MLRLTDVKQIVQRDHQGARRWINHTEISQPQIFSIAHTSIMFVLSFVTGSEKTALVALNAKFYRYSPF